MSIPEVIRHLQDARNALPSRTDLALGSLLEAFRGGPSSALAELVVVLSHAMSERRAPLTDDEPSERALEERWTRLYKRGDPADTDRLLDTALRTASASVADKRLTRLARCPSRDPRISRWVTACIRDGQLAARGDEERSAMVRLIWAMADPTTVAELRTLAGEPSVKDQLGTPWCESVLRACHAAQRTYVPGPEEPALYAAIEGLLGETRAALAATPRRTFADDEAFRHDAAALAREAARQTGEVPDVAPLLAAALEQLRSGGDPLATLIEAWQRMRDARIATLVDLASAVAVPREPILERPVGKAVVAWIEVERATDPADLPRLLDGLLIGNSSQIRAKIERLEQARDDPRVARRLVHMLELQPFTSSSAFAAYASAFRLLAALGDERAIPRLEATAAALPAVTLSGGRTFAERFAGGIRSTIAKLRARKRAELDASTTALLERLSADLEERAARHLPDGAAADALLAAIWADPRADAPRLVYADWLLERGSPHGELIILQIQGATTARAERRVAALLERHGRSFLGALEPAIVPGHARFERGFVAHCELVARAAPAVDELVGHAAWATVRTFALPEPHAPERQRLADHLIALGASRVAAV